MSVKCSRSKSSLRRTTAHRCWCNMSELKETPKAIDWPRVQIGAEEFTLRYSYASNYQLAKWGKTIQTATNVELAASRNGSGRNATLSSVARCRYSGHSVLVSRRPMDCHGWQRPSGSGSVQATGQRRLAGTGSDRTIP